MNKKIISKILLFSSLILFSASNFAAKMDSDLNAQPYSVQLVTIMNSLVNPENPSTKTPVQVNFYDIKNGVEHICWTPTVKYHQDPVVGGSGSDNGCAPGIKEGDRGIIKIDIIPQEAPSLAFGPAAKTGGQIVYESKSAIIPTGTFYNTIIITQDTPPTFEMNGKIKKKGTIKIISFTEQGESKK